VIPTVNTPPTSWVSPGLTRRRAGLGAIAAVLALLVWVICSPGPSAQAAPGRRLCDYIDNVPTYVQVRSKTQTGVYHTIPATLYVAINYKKDGACPDLPDPYLVDGNSNKPVRLSSAQPVPKDKCEDWFRKIGVTRQYDGTITESDPPLSLVASDPGSDDICTIMAEDTVYEFYVSSADRYFADGSSYLQGEFVTNKRWNVRS
jgi:hypothetical protein